MDEIRAESYKEKQSVVFFDVRKTYGACCWRLSEVNIQILYCVKLSVKPLVQSPGPICFELDDTYLKNALSSPLCGL